MPPTKSVARATMMMVNIIVHFVRARVAFNQDFTVQVPAFVNRSKSLKVSNIDQRSFSPRSKVFCLLEAGMQKPYAWREAYVHAVLETNPELKFVRIYDAIAAIEQRRLSPVESDEERWELEKADEGIQALISERNLKFV